MPDAKGVFLLDAELMPCSSPDEENGLPVQLFRKEMLRVGKWTHPKHGWTLDVDAARLDRLASTFHTMKTNGYDVEVVVDHKPGAENVRGYLTDVYREGGTLFGTHKMIGADAITLARRVKNVSVGIRRNFKDGAGHEYAEGIVHSAICQQPVVTNQEGFVPIAASSGGEELVYAFSLSSNKEQTMKIEDLRTVLGLGDELTEENWQDKLKGLIGESKTALDAANTKAGGLETQLSTAQGEVNDLKANAMNLSMDPDVLEELADANTLRIDALVPAGRLSQNVADELKVILVGPKEGRNVVCLSRKASGGNDPLARRIVTALEKNAPVKPGIKTGSQISKPGEGDEGDKDFCAETNAEMKKMAGVE